MDAIIFSLDRDWIGCFGFFGFGFGCFGFFGFGFGLGFSLDWILVLVLVFLDLDVSFL